MKTLLFTLVIMFYGLYSKAATNFNADTLRRDTAIVNKQSIKLSTELTDLKTQLINTQNQIKIDSAKLESALSKSHDAQEKSKKRSEQAVGGDLDDAKLAQKQAKRAEKLTSETQDASKQLERDRKKAKKLTKQIEKTQEKLDKIQNQ
jgi:hypothetical protein